MRSVLLKLMLMALLPGLGLLSGCDVKNTPIPLQDSPLVGVWEANRRVQKDSILQVERMYLEFTEQGYVAFHRINCWAELDNGPKVWKMKDFNIDFMPVIKLTQKKIKAQWMPFTPKVELSIDRWPEEINGVQQMQVDGMVLTAKEQASDHAEWACQKLAAE